MKGQPEDLSLRQREIVELIGMGFSTSHICDYMGISANTLHSHLQSIRRRVGVNGRQAIRSWAVDHGMSPLTTRLSLEERDFLFGATAETGIEELV